MKALDYEGLRDTHFDATGEPTPSETDVSNS